MVILTYEYLQCYVRIIILLRMNNFHYRCWEVNPYDNDVCWSKFRFESDIIKFVDMIMGRARVLFDYMGEKETKEILKWIIETFFFDAK